MVVDPTTFATSSRHRPRPTAQTYLRLRTLPGEQCQCDWGHFGHIQIAQAKQPLMAFVMALSWSRPIFLRIFLRFFLGAHMENFLRGHVQAFESWGSAPRVTTLHNNLKSAVRQRKGQTKGQQIEVDAHLEELVQHQRAARAHRDTDRLVHAVPKIQTLLNEAAKWGEPLGRTA